MRTRLLVSGAAIAVLVVAGVVATESFLRGVDRERRTETDLDPVTIGAYAGDTAALVWIADEQGFFTDAGLRATIEPFEAGKLAADALSANAVDVTTSADFVLVKKSFAEPDLRVLASVSRADVNKVIARKDRGVETPRDLKGKRIAVTTGSVAEFFLGNFLVFNGLTLDDVTIEDRIPSQLVDAVGGGSVDAGITWEPNVSRIRKRLGGNASVFPGQSGQSFYFVLLAKQGWLDRHDRTAQRLLSALVEAERFVSQRPEELQSLLEKKFGYSKNRIARSLEDHTFLLELPQSILPTFEDQARWMIDNRLVRREKAPNFLEFIHFDALAEVKPDAVTVVR